VGLLRTSEHLDNVRFWSLNKNSVRRGQQDARHDRNTALPHPRCVTTNHMGQDGAPGMRGSVMRRDVIRQSSRLSLGSFSVTCSQMSTIPWYTARVNNKLTRPQVIIHPCYHAIATPLPTEGGHWHDSHMPLFLQSGNGGLLRHDERPR